MTLDIHRFEKNESLVETLVGEVETWLAEAIAERGYALLAVSGGRTPAPFFRALSRCTLDWSRVTVTLADERWVPEDHGDSNARLVQQHLLQGPAARARFVGLYSDAPTLEEGAAVADARLRGLGLPFDAVILGMGEDGHTASLMPGSEALMSALNPRGGRLCRAVRAPGVVQPRLTLTLAALLTSRRILLHIVGDAKWRVLERARTPGPVAELPVRAVLHQQRVPVRVYYADGP